MQLARFLNNTFKSLISDIIVISEHRPVVLVIYTQKKFRLELESCSTTFDGFPVRVEIITFDSFGISDSILPRGELTGKYEFLSGLHNHFISTSSSKSILVFNYCDFYWSENSLVDALKPLFDESHGAVYSFCLPLDKTETLKKLDPTRNHLSRKEKEKEVQDNLRSLLHVEATRRIIGNDEFSSFPTYLIW